MRSQRVRGQQDAMGDVAFQDHYTLGDALRKAEAKLLSAKTLQWGDLRCLYLDVYHVPKAWNAAICSKYCISAMLAAFGPPSMPQSARKAASPPCSLHLVYRSHRQCTLRKASTLASPPPSSLRLSIPN
jgi:hypothetical protein